MGVISTGRILRYACFVLEKYRAQSGGAPPQATGGEVLIKSAAGSTIFPREPDTTGKLSTWGCAHDTTRSLRA